MKLTDDDRYEIAEKCAAALASVAYDWGNHRLELLLTKVTEQNVDKGDWLIIVERLPKYPENLM